MAENTEGIINPPIDDLLKREESKYALVIDAAQRARQINAYYAQLHEGLFEYVGPLVDTHMNEKPLSIALREFNEGLLDITPLSEKAAQQQKLEEDEAVAAVFSDDQNVIE